MNLPGLIKCGQKDLNPIYYSYHSGMIVTNVNNKTFLLPKWKLGGEAPWTYKDLAMLAVVRIPEIRDAVGIGVIDSIETNEYFTFDPVVLGTLGYYELFTYGSIYKNFPLSRRDIQPILNYKRTIICVDESCLNLEFDGFGMAYLKEEIKYEKWTVATDISSKPQPDSQYSVPVYYGVLAENNGISGPSLIAIGILDDLPHYITFNYLEYKRNGSAAVNNIYPLPKLSHKDLQAIKTGIVNIQQ